MSIKKLVCAAAMVFCMGFAANAADMSPNALGVRLFFPGGGELNYQRALGGTRLEIGVNYNFDAGYLGAGAAYHLLHQNIGVKGLNWYIGPKAYVGLGDDLSVGAAAQGGIEYKFDFPLLLSLDVEPSLSILPSVDWGGVGAGLGIRYLF